MSNSNFGNHTLTKHEKILQYIQSLKIGAKVSVRSIAKELEVSEGTAYRALKEAESFGFVSTKERIGTVRIQKKQRKLLDQLTFAEVADIVEGHVLGGTAGLEKTLYKFVIGAMELDAMLGYIDAGSLLIVGNRDSAHKCALEQGAGVLITGGFGASRSSRELADELGLPVISSSHDTFTVASMINRAMYDRLIKRKIMLLEDIVTLGPPAAALKLGQTTADFERLLRQSGHTRFPVVDDWGRVVGMITAKDVAMQAEQPIDKLMTRRPVTASPTLPVASAAHKMASEGIDLLPVVDRQRKLLAVVTRQEVMRAMQFANEQANSGETFEELIWSGFERVTGETEGSEFNIAYRGQITPQMSGAMGTISEGVLVTLLAQAARSFVREVGKRDHVLESLTTFFVRPVQIDSEVTLRPRMLEMSRRSAKLEMELSDPFGLAAKVMLTVQMIDG